MKQKTKKTIVIPNKTNKTVVYLVETDLVNSWGENRIEIPGNSSYSYVLNVNPLFGGVYTGQITF